MNDFFQMGIYQKDAYAPSFDKLWMSGLSALTERAFSPECNRRVWMSGLSALTERAFSPECNRRVRERASKSTTKLYANVPTSLIQSLSKDEALLHPFQSLIRFLFFALLFLCIPLQATPATDAQLNQQATEAFEQKQYDYAYVLYEKILEKTSSIHYQMSVCACKAGRLGYAQLHLRRAEMDCGLLGQYKIRLQRKAIDELSIGRRSAKQKFLYFETILTPVHAVKETCINFIKAVPIIFFQLFVLLVWGCLFACLSMLIRRRKKVLLVLLFLLQIGAATALALKYNAKYKNFLVVLKNDIPLYSGPGSDYALLGHLQEAQEADILNEVTGYYKVRASYTIGWIEKNFVEKV